MSYETVVKLSIAVIRNIVYMIPIIIFYYSVKKNSSEVKSIKMGAITHTEKWWT